jgi:3,4-dihydroxyphthalate decarboxylase
MADPGPGIEVLREKVALACRVLAREGLVRDIIGHVSARVPGTGEMLLRCRGGEERGLAYTVPDQVRRVTFEGSEPGEGYALPLELPIHGETYRARPEVGAVVHAHPEASLLCGLAGIELRPVFGAFDPYALAIAAEGVPVFPRAVLIDTPALATGLVAVMGRQRTCLMRGHGVTVTGATVEEATIGAIKLEALARVCWELARSGRTVPELPPGEVASFERPGGGGIIAGGEEWLWRYYAARAAQPGPP